MNVPLQAYWRLLARYLRPQRGKVSLLALLLFSGIAIQLVNPQIIRYFIDTTQTSSAPQSLLMAALIYIVAAFVQQALTVGATYVGEDVALRSTNQLRADLVAHCLGLDMDFHHEHTPGEFIERIDGDVSMLGNFFSRFTIQIVGSLLLFIGILVVLLLEDWRVGLVITLFALATFPILARIKHVATPQWAATRQSSAELYSYIEERLTGTEDLRARGATAYVLRGFHALTQQLLQRERRAQFLSLVSFGAASVFVVMGNVIALLASAYLYTAGSLTIGTVYLIFFYTNLLSQPINRLSEQLEDLNRAAASIARVQEVMGLQSHLVAGEAQLPVKAPTVHFRHITFAYQTNPVLNDISFMLQPGQVLGLLGRTGSGKTTISRLLLRLYDPQAGQILLDGQDLRASLRRQVGIVTQHVELFHAAVRDNLTFFDPTYADARIIEVLHEIGLGDWYATLPDGLDTRLSPGGTSLSTGEAQLLAFARVFLAEPNLVILDEASSRLDPASERLLDATIDKLLQGRTAIIIAHRLATVQRADRILILEQGCVVEEGAREVLASDPTSRYCQLLTAGTKELLG